MISTNLKAFNSIFFNFVKFKVSPDVFILFIILEFHAYIQCIYSSFLNTIFLPISFWLPPPFLHPYFTSYFYNPLSYQCCLSVYGSRVSHSSNLTIAMTLEKTDFSYQIFQLSKLIEEKEFHEPLQSLCWNCDWFYLAQELCLHMKFMAAVISMSRRHCFIAVLLSYFLPPSMFPTMLFEPWQ